MTKTTKELKKSLKGPDQLQQWFLGVSTYVEKNRKTVLLALGGFVVLIVGGIVGTYYWQQSAESERAALASIDLKQQQAVQEWTQKQTEIQGEIIRLQTQIDTTKKAGQSTASLEKQKSALEAQQSDEPKFGNVSQEYLAYFKKHPHKTTGWVAGVRAAEFLIRDDKYAEARDILQTVLEKGKHLEFYNVQVRFMLVGIYEQLGEYDAALAALEPLAKKQSEDLEPMVLLSKGRIYLHKKDNENAEKFLRELVQKYASADEARTARGMIALL